MQGNGTNIQKLALTAFCPVVWCVYLIAQVVHVSVLANALGPRLDTTLVEL